MGSRCRARAPRGRSSFGRVSDRLPCQHSVDVLEFFHENDACVCCARGRLRGSAARLRDGRRAGVAGGDGRGHGRRARARCADADARRAKRRPQCPCSSRSSPTARAQRSNLVGYLAMPQDAAEPLPGHHRDSRMVGAERQHQGDDAAARRRGLRCAGRRSLRRRDGRDARGRAGADERRCWPSPRRHAATWARPTTTSRSTRLRRASRASAGAWAAVGRCRPRCCIRTRSTRW